MAINKKLVDDMILSIEQGNELIRTIRNQSIGRSRRDIMDNSTDSAGVTFTSIDHDGNKLEMKLRPDMKVSDLRNHFDDFLKGCGYALEEEWK